jgi:hypothetical protein
MNDEIIAVWGLGAFWLLISILLLIYAFRNPSGERKLSMAYAFSASHLLAPTLMGGWSWAIVIPATYSIYGNIISLVTGEFFFFRRKEAIQWMMYASVCWLITFLLLWGFIALCRHLFSEPSDKKEEPKESAH